MNTKTIILLLDILLIFIITCIFAVIVKNNTNFVEGYNNNICADITDPNAEISCYDYLKQCEPSYYDTVVDEKNDNKYDIDAGKRARREWILRDLKLHIDRDGSNRKACKIDGKRLKRYNISDDSRTFHKWGNCPEGASWQGWPNGCVFQFYEIKKGVSIPRQRCEHKWVFKFPLPRRIVVCEPALWRMMDGAWDNYVKSTVGDSGHYSGHIDQNWIDTGAIPDIKEELDENRKLLYEYNHDFIYNTKVRCGYIWGFSYDTGTPKWGQLPVIQKKFKIENETGGFIKDKKNRSLEKYFSLVFRYSSKKYREQKENMGDQNVSRWFSRNDPLPNGIISHNGDPYLNHESVADFLADDNWLYRNRFLLERARAQPINSTFIIEVCNKKDKNSPVKVLLSLQFSKHVADGDGRGEESIERFFRHHRLEESENTTNKTIISDQNNYEFKIDAGSYNAWIIYNRNDWARFYMGIFTNGGMFDGDIIVSNPCVNNGASLHWADITRNLAEKKMNLAWFKENHVGQWMNVWMLTDVNDQFQFIPMIKHVNIKSSDMDQVFKRQANSEGKEDSDIKWASKIWLHFTMEESMHDKIIDTIHLQDEVKQLANMLKGKKKMSFDIYKWVCETAGKTPTSRKVALKKQCYYQDKKSLTYKEERCSN